MQFETGFVPWHHGDSNSHNMHVQDACAHITPHNGHQITTNNENVDTSERCCKQFRFRNVQVQCSNGQVHHQQAHHRCKLLPGHSAYIEMSSAYRILVSRSPMSVFFPLSARPQYMGNSKVTISGKKSDGLPFGRPTNTGS